MECEYEIFSSVTRMSSGNGRRSEITKGHGVGKESGHSGKSTQHYFVEFHKQSTERGHGSNEYIWDLGENV